MGVLLIAALFLFLLALQLAHRQGHPIHVTVAGGSAHVGAAAPDFTTQQLDGATVQLSQFRGKPVLLNFWATWCAPCQDEMPLLQRALDRYGGAGFTVLAVDYQQTDLNSMRAFLRKVGARFPAVYDPAGQIAGEYGVTVGLPVSIFIDRSGAVAFIQLGQMSDAMLQQHLHSIL
ncbi:MAG TPA: TlpA disulfide reductase family protein [Candidatus Dormibacteraeota bacterium]|nr:TlpA disulfide reductase family protein [Candidatus Dormibacteraeota bacterium]